MERIEEVLVEDENSKDKNQVMGRTIGNLLTFFTVVHPFSLTGEVVAVREMVSV